MNSGCVRILLVVDMQRGFINKYNNTLGNKIRAHINESEYEYIIFTKFTNTGIPNNFINKLGYTGMIEVNDTEIVEELRDIANNNIIVTKSSYSCLKSEQLNTLLNNLNTGYKLYICGTDSDACILATLYEAFDMGIDFEILEGLVGSSSRNQYVSEAVGLIIHRNLSKR